VLDDPVERTADQLVGALGTHPGRYANHIATYSAGDAIL
jgi:hypothetical protein